MRTKPEEIEELIRRQPRLTSERFWQQLERAKTLLPSVESLKTVPLEEEAPLRRPPRWD